ncbi:hypothetical protein [Halorussus salinisoli]|uniref:hypothetical protein n=1 Tax=Halorussus salinisoli TaxID=2558242 RepID=UPI002A91A561|nr:hypothetical protein [Halorussus salinisoli]
MPESTYSVYLVQRHGEQGGKREVTSPVSGHSLEFYDTGVWLDRKMGRNFFPYEQIRTIREHPEDEQSESENRDRTSRQSEGERPGQRSGEGDPGAEEEMLEE